MNAAENTKDEIFPPIGIIAGSGIFPREVLTAARAKGVSTVLVAHRGETDPALESLAGSTTWIKVGQLKNLIAAVKRGKVKQVIFAGGISRVRLFGGVSLDMLALKVLSSLRSIRDDALLKAVARELERHGLSVLPASALLKELSPKAGLITKRDFLENEKKDAILGWEVAKGLGTFDVGQAVVICDQLVIAVEAIEGTDLMVTRAGELLRARGAHAGGVLVKCSKPQQDLRLDLPTIGPRTIELMKQAKLSSLVIEAEKSILLDPQKVVELADGAGIAIRVISNISELK